MPHSTGTAPAALDVLRTRHSRWRISFLQFADGPNYDATPLDEREHRLVVGTAAELDKAIAAVEAGTWQP